MYNFKAVYMVVRLYQTFLFIFLVLKQITIYVLNWLKLQEQQLQHINILEVLSFQLPYILISSIKKPVNENFCILYVVIKHLRPISKTEWKVTNNQAEVHAYSNV